MKTPNVLSVILIVIAIIAIESDNTRVASILLFFTAIGNIAVLTTNLFNEKEEKPKNPKFIVLVKNNTPYKTMDYLGENDLVYTGVLDGQIQSYLKQECQIVEKTS